MTAAARRGRSRALLLGCVVLGLTGCAGDAASGADGLDGPDAADVAEPVDAADGAAEFAQLVARYDLLTTAAGRGEVGEDGVNSWLAAYEGGPASAAELSRPHMAQADAAGRVFIADKDAHAIRRVDPDGTVHTVAGSGVAGDDGDAAGPAVARRLSSPNGLWVREDGVFYPLDLGNDKIRRVGVDGVMTTLATDAEGLAGGRGLWVAADERLAYWSSETRVRRWRAGVGIDTYASGFVDLGNLVVGPDGVLVVTDRGAHRVYRVPAPGVVEPLAGSGATAGGAEGAPALEQPLWGVRGVWPMDTGGYLLATHEGSAVHYLDRFGGLHLFLAGAPGAHAGDGQFFRAPGAKVSEVRAVTVAPNGDVLVTEHDSGFVRRVRRR